MSELIKNRMSDLRQGVIDVLIKWYGCKPSDLSAFEDMLDELLSAQKKGEWIDRGDEYIIRWTCSECGRKDIHIYNFCPDCGADMRKEVEE